MRFCRLSILRLVLAALAPLAPHLAGEAAAQTTDPFPEAIRAREGVIRIDYRELATLPDVEGEAARMMILVGEPGGSRLFVNEMRGRLFTLGSDGSAVTEYLNTDDARWGQRVQSRGRERGFQSFALHPQFRERGAPGYGRIYTWSDVVDTIPAPDFTPGGGNNTHDTVLLEWRARDPGAATYDGDAPREVLRLEQPFANHNGGQIAFNPNARPGDADFGLLYIGNADGGSGGDPLNLAQNLGSVFGKILRIDPLAGSADAGYGIPESNPFVGRGGARGEVFVLGVRNPQRFGWDSQTGMLYVADIGQNTVEEISPAPAGANLGWNVWEGSFRFAGREGVHTAGARSDANMTYPVAEYDHTDSLMIGRAAVTGLIVYRGDAVPELRGRIVFGDLTSGEIFHVPADEPPGGGQAGVGRVLLARGGGARTLLELIRAQNEAQARAPAARADLRFGTAADGRIFLLNKHDGTIRVLGRTP